MKNAEIPEPATPNTVTVIWSESERKKWQLRHRMVGGAAVGISLNPKTYEQIVADCDEPLTSAS